MDNNDSIKPETQHGAATEHESCQKELSQFKERYLYLNAEFDNYKKRLEKERSAWVAQAQDEVLVSLLSTLDDMDRALEEFKKLPSELAVHGMGLEIIAKGLQKILSHYDIQEIPLVKEFDPERFEAVMQVASDSHASGEIVSILQKGYMRHGRILRPAKVSVAQ